MMFSTIVNYVCGLMIVGRWNPIGETDVSPGENPASLAQRKIAVIISSVSSLGLLGFFKYFGFVQRNINMFMGLFGGGQLDVMEFVLPAGISFYTFQAMSYTIDLYRGHAEPARSPLDFACYVSLFPQLIAGPIVRYKDIIADATFGAGSPIWYDAWAGIGAYAFQIYFDFSGYSDMAIGLGLMLGFQFRKNFDSPYKADSITDFWRRWHISLSSWLRDNLYIPLGGNRLGERRTYINLFIVMLLGGLWHGAKWTFVIWGGVHGILLASERLIGKDSVYRRLPRPVRIAVTFAIVLITWVFFRADDLTSAMRYLGSMFGLRQPAAGAALLGSVIYSRDHLIALFACAITAWFGKQSWDIAQKISPTKAVIMIILFVWTVAAMFTQSFNPFLYFQF